MIDSNKFNEKICCVLDSLSPLDFGGDLSHACCGQWSHWEGRYYIVQPDTFTDDELRAEIQGRRAAAFGKMSYALDRTVGHRKCVGDVTETVCVNAQNPRVAEVYIDVIYMPATEVGRELAH